MSCSDTVNLPSEDGHVIFLRRWIPDGPIRALVQISHGMVEHSERYDLFAREMGKQGFAVYAHDHRGHGRSAVSERDLGFLAESNGFARTVRDVRLCIKRLAADFPGKKVFLFGHSFGSFVSQSYIESYGSTIDGCILCGSAGPRPALVYFARIFAGINKGLFGERHRSRFINNLAFGPYNSRIKNKRTVSDWLSRDPDQVDKYLADPFCTFIPTASFFYDLFDGLCHIHKKANIAHIPNALPLFLCAGTGDPVGDYGKTVQDLYDIYKDKGIADIELKLYPRARHELLNETNKEEVIADIVKWLLSRC